MSPAERTDVAYRSLLNAELATQVDWLLGSEGDPKQPPPSLPDPDAWRQWVADRLAAAIDEVRRQLDAPSPELSAAQAALAEHEDRKPSKKDKDAKKRLKSWQKQRDKLARTIDTLERERANQQARQRGVLDWFDA